MSEAQMHDDLVKVIIAAVQLLAVAVGWSVVSRGNDKREKRKEIRSILNEIGQLVTQIETRALEYHKRPAAESEDLAIQLKQQLKRLSTLATTATRMDSRLALSNQVLDLRRAVSGGDFESASRNPRQTNDPLFSEIALAAAELVDSAEDAFSKIYN